MFKEVDCGLKKWKIGITETGTVVLSFDQYPIETELQLNDCSLREFRALGAMFSEAADHFDAQIETIQLEKRLVVEKRLERKLAKMK